MVIRKLPKFDSEDDERELWATHDATDYFDLAGAQRVRFPALRPSTQTISVRLPIAMLADLREIANRLDVPYQSLMKVLIAEGIERRTTRPGGRERRRGATAQRAPQDR